MIHYTVLAVLPIFSYVYIDNGRGADSVRIYGLQQFSELVAVNTVVQKNFLCCLISKRSHITYMIFSSLSYWNSNKVPLMRVPFSLFIHC